MPIDDNTMYLCFLVLNLFLMVMVRQTGLNKGARGVCYFFLTLSLLSFQDLGPKTFAGSIVALIVAVSSNAIPSPKVPVLRRYRHVFAVICIVVSIWGLFSISIETTAILKDRDRRDQQAKMNGLIYTIAANIEREKWKTPGNTEYIEEIYRSHLADETDDWGNRFHCSVEYTENRYKVILISAGKDRKMNTDDDITQAVEL